MSTEKKAIDNSDEIILGSGDLFLAKFTGEIPDDTTIENVHCLHRGADW